MFVRGHVYDFSPTVIADFLNIPIWPFNDFEKEFPLNKVAYEILSTQAKWPKNTSLILLI
ncbi:hypothetical protein PanWU01x14_152700 [Parasponia andersonii]|uniref:Uncharacterized protein n=1 Tax=Parasponia andersonii TaxID=3476 RepID=A0A2P5CHF2_PARAD|nr:hypothetical protein PanWU01x14_152700 [Parasponia andersonii]